jgi:hypothetical protein
MASEVAVYFGRCSLSWGKFVECCGLDSKSATAYSGSVHANDSCGLTTMLSFREDRLANKPVDCLELISMSRSSLSTDPRDKLFALLGLSFSGTQLITEPNYINSIVDVFMEFTMALLKSYGKLDYIYLKAANRRMAADLPSWVPDWTKLDDIVARRQFDYIANLPRKLGPGGESVITVSKAALIVTGEIFNKAHRLGNTFSGRNGGIEVPRATTSILPEPNIELNIVFKTLTRVGLYPNRTCDDQDHHYATLDGSYRKDQRREIESIHGFETASESLTLVHARVLANSTVRIEERSLGEWWEILNAAAGQIRDVQRVDSHIYNAISCGMRLLVTVGGRVG